jgi:hypothetical protein
MIPYQSTLPSFFRQSTSLFHNPPNEDVKLLLARVSVLVSYYLLKNFRVIINSFGSQLAFKRVDH